MTEVKGVGRRRTQLLDDLRNRRRFLELKEEVLDVNDSLSIEYKEEIKMIFHKFMDLIISNIPNNNIRKSSSMISDMKLHLIIKVKAVLM